VSKTIGDLTQNDIGKYVTITSIVEGKRHRDFVVTGVLNYVEHGEDVNTVVDRTLSGDEVHHEVARIPYTSIQVGPGYFDQIDPSARVQGIDL
jgi:hypothetical protein